MSGLAIEFLASLVDGSRDPFSEIRTSAARLGLVKDAPMGARECRCGEELLAEAVFCRICGAPIEDADQQRTPRETIDQAPCRPSRARSDQAQVCCTDGLSTLGL